MPRREDEAPLHMTYSQEKLWVAVDALATGTGSLQERLLDAWRSALARLDADLQPGHFANEEARESFRALRAEATSKPAKGDEGTLAATLLAMSDEEAQKHAGAILSLHVDVGCLGHNVAPRPDRSARGR